MFFWKTVEVTSSMDDLSKPDQDTMSKAQESPQETRSKTIAGLQVEAVQNGFDIGDKIPEFTFNQLQVSFIQQAICLEIPSFIFIQPTALKVVRFKQRDFLSFMKLWQI